MGIIYLCISPSGKKYIGQHMSDDFKHRLYTHKYNYIKFLKSKLILELNKKFYPDKKWPSNPSGYCTSLYCAFQKYSFESFKWEVLYTNIPRCDLNTLEDKLIIENNSIAPNGYNLKTNDKINGFAYSAESRKKMSDSQKIAVTKYLHKYRRGHGMLTGMPQHITYYESGGVRGYRILRHPNCPFKQFVDASTPVEELKRQTMAFLKECESVPYITTQQRIINKGMVKGLTEQYANKFCASFRYKGQRESRYFSKGTREENLRDATVWITEKRKELKDIYEKGPETK